MCEILMTYESISFSTYFLCCIISSDLVDQSDPTDLEGPEHLGKEPLHHCLNKVVGVGVADHYKEGVQVLEFRIILTGSKLCGKN